MIHDKVGREGEGRKGDNILDIRRRSSNQDLESPLLGNPAPNGGIKVPDRILIDRNTQVLRLTGLQLDLLKRRQLLFRARQPALLVMDIHLDRLEALHGTDVADGHDQVDGAVLGQHARAERRPPVLERRV